MKKKIAIIFCLMFLSLIFIAGFQQKDTFATVTDSELKAITLVESLTNSFTQSDATIMNDFMYNEAFEEELIVVESDQYIFLITEDSLQVRAIILMDETNIRYINGITSKNTALDAIQKYAQMVVPEFFENYDYQVIFNTYGQENNEIYSVEFWQEISDNFYTGNKIAVMVTSDGILQSFVSVNSNSNSDVMAISDENQITEEEAISEAYDSLKEVVMELETNYLSYNSYEIGDVYSDNIISDSGVIVNANNTEKSISKYEIMIDDVDTHEITTYRETNNGRVQWVIKINGVKTNYLWDIDFEVIVDAQSGEILNVYHTR